jgi:hypothetical protein
MLRSGRLKTKVWLGHAMNAAFGWLQQLKDDVASVDPRAIYAIRALKRASSIGNRVAWRGVSRQTVQQGGARHGHNFGFNRVATSKSMLDSRRR